MMTPEAALDAVMAAVGREASSYYHYLQEGGKREEWRSDYAAVRDAVLDLVIAELEALPCPAGHEHICGRADELRAMRSER